MTDEELLEIETRAKAATPGPWTSHRTIGGRRGVSTELYCDGDSPDVADCWCSGKKQDDDVVFIAHARADVPRLIAALRSARVAREDLELALDDAEEAVYLRAKVLLPRLAKYIKDYERAKKEKS